MRWRRVRARFGISAPRLAIRPHVPWYWRAAATIVILGFALALGRWIYDAGRSFAGFERTESEQQLEALRSELQKVQEENFQLRKVANVSESTFQMEQVTKQRMTDQIRRLELENGQLKEELAVLESMTKGGGKSSATPVISRLQVELDGRPGNYRYRMLLSTENGNSERDLAGSIQLAVTALQKDKPVILVVPGAGRVSFRRFLRHSGIFQVPPDVQVKEVEARFLVGGAVAATSKVTLY